MSARPAPPRGATLTGGGAFDRDEQNVYFVASQADKLEWASPFHRHLLIAVNEVTASDEPWLRGWASSGKRLFLDSGVFNLSTAHARAHGLTMDRALGLAPDQVDGFAELFDKYVDLVRRFGDGLWGYIEIDQGGRDNKIKTRARLEGMGLRPIPVYHPLNDGWDYFDYLAERYDRICFGNIVQAPPPVRKRLLATAWERHRRYPHLWIHLLGLTPNQWLNAYPIDSGDSSSWLSGQRWASGARWRCAGQNFGKVPAEFRYRLGDRDGPTGYIKATGLAAYAAHMDMRNWRTALGGLHALGCEDYPAGERMVQP